MGKMNALNISLENILNEILLSAEKVSAKNNELLVQKFFDCLVAKNVEISSEMDSRKILSNQNCKEQLKNNLQHALEAYLT